LTLTVPVGPIEVGQTLSYTVTIVNSGSTSLTGLTWRDVTAETAAQALSDLVAGDSISVSGTFGPMQDDHMPHITLTVAADSDQTDEIVSSKVVQVVAATSHSTESNTQSDSQSNEQSSGLSGEALTGVRPKVPSSLVLRVVRNQFNVPDVHLAHNIPDLHVTLPDGSETSCNFLTHYENTGGLTRWGHTTSEVLEERPGSLTQYYQRGGVDCHAREGQWLMERRLAWDHFGGGIDGSEDLGVEPHLLSDQPGELLGPWGHKVSNYAVDGTYIGFLDFFTAFGGVPAFGYPKTDARHDDDPRRRPGPPGRGTPGHPPVLTGRRAGVRPGRCGPVRQAVLPWRRPARLALPGLRGLRQLRLLPPAQRRPALLPAGHVERPAASWLSRTSRQEKGFPHRTDDVADKYVANGVRSPAPGALTLAMYAAGKWRFDAGRNAGE
jgi:hypothetical protein